MTRNEAILLTLIVYKLALVAIGLWAQRRTSDNTDFFLGGRRLGPMVAAISASASSSSAWTLLGVSGAAFAWGIPALWLFPATVSGFLINWLWVAPRLMAASRARQSVTAVEFIAGQGPERGALLRLATLIVVFSFAFYVAAQFQAAGDAFAVTFEIPRTGAILLGAAVVLLYTLLGGFWAVSVTDTLQGLLMAATAIALPVAALWAVGGFDGLMAGLAQSPDVTALSSTGRHTGFAAIGFVLGVLGIGLGYPGQPHVVNRFMALRDTRALSQARVIAIAWAVIVYAGMLLLGLCARVLLDAQVGTEQAFFVVANQLFPPVVAGVMIAAVLSAIMSTADSQLLVAASSVTHDWRLAVGGAGPAALRRTRLAVLIVGGVAVALALLAPDTIFRRVLFAWHAIGSAFGPLLVMRLAGFGFRPGFAFVAMLSGFAATVFFHWLPDTLPPGDTAERLVPLLLAGAIAFAGRRRLATPMEPRANV